MMSRLVFLLFCGNIALLLGNAQKLPRVKRQSLKVQINVTSDGVCMRYIRPSTSTKLEGFILGYGSSFFSNQYISLPADGKSYMTEVDAEPRYLISVRPLPVTNYKKSCSGKTHTPKPLQLVIGTLTPTSVFLSWGILVNPKHDWTTMNNCANDRFYTVRYREKDKNKKWALQLCPTTETVVDNLKPNAVYEFGVKDNTDNGIWSKIFNHKVVMPSKNKENGQPQNNYILHNIQTQFVPGNSKVLHPVTIIKQVLQNVTQRTKPKIPEKSPLAGPILVHLIVPDFNGTQQKLLSPFTLDVPEKPKKTPAKNETQEWPAESKTPEVQEISPQSQPAMAELDWESSKPTTPSVLKESESPSARTDSELEASERSVTPMAELSLDILAPYKFPEFPKTKTPPTYPMPTETLASHEIESVSSESQTPVPKGTRTQQVFSKTQPALSRPRTPDETEISDSKRAVTNEPTPESLTPKTAKPLDWPKSTLAPPETASISIKRKPSDTPEGRQVKPAPNLPPLKHNTPKTSRILEKTTAIPGAPVETNFIPSIPKPSTRPKMPDVKYAEKEYQWEATTHKMFKPVEFPRTTKVPSKTKIPVSKPQILPHLEQPKIVPAVTRTLIPVPATTMVSGVVQLPVATMASYESSSIPFKPKEPDYIVPEVPDSKPGSYESGSIPSKPKEPDYTMPEVQDSKPASYESTSISSKPKKPNYTMPEVQDSKPASYETSSISSKSKETDYIMPEVQDSKPASYESSSIPSKPKERDYIMPDIQDRKPVSYESSSIPSKPRERDYIMPDVQDRKPASYESSSIPSKPKEHDYIIPDIQDRKPASYETSSITSKPKETDYIMPGVQDSKPASYESSSIPSKPKERDYIMPDIQDRKPASYESSPIPSQPKEHDYIIPDIQDRKPASYDSSSIPSKPKEHDYIIPDIQDRKPVSYESSSIPSKPRERDYIMPDVQDRKPASYESSSISSKPKETDYIMPEVQESEPVSYESSSIPSKPREHDYIMPDVQDRKPAPYKSSSIPFKPKEPDCTMPEVQDSKPASYESSSIPFKPKEPDYIIPEVPDSKPGSYESSSIPSKPKEPDYTMPEVQDSKPASYELSSISSKPKEPANIMPDIQDSKPASYELSAIPSKPKELDYTVPEVQDSIAASYELSAIPSKPKEPNYTVPEVQDNKPAFYESSSIPSKPKEPDYTMPEVQDSKPDSAEADNFSFKVPTTTELPFIDSAPKVKEHVYSPKTTITPHLLHTKPVLEPIVLETDPPKTEIEERPPVSTRPKNWFITDAPQTKPDMEPVTFRIEQPKSTLAPKETSRVPARLKTSPSPSIIRTKPTPKGSRRVPSKPKVPPTKSSLKIPPTKSAEITPFSPDPITIMVPHVPEKAKATLASTVEQFIPNKSNPSTKPRMVETKPAIHRTTSQPFVLKPTVSSEQIKTIMAPKETWFISSKPKTSGKLDGPPSKPVPDAIHPTYPGSINLHIHVFNGPKDGLASTKPHSGVTTESPHLKTAVHKVHDTTAKPKTTDKTRSRPVVNKTTPVPGRTRTPGGVAWNKLSRGDKLTDQDATKLLSTSSSIRSNSSIHSSGSRKKPDPVATPPDPPRPPLASAKPTPVRRKPLPPNTVTGKPGRSGNILMPRAPPPSAASSPIKPAGPTGHAKTSSHKKPPTAASSPDYSNPMFSSLPTTETDVAGTPRYTGDHVKYMKKEEDVPCSITDTLQHFPTEDGENIDTATTPPRKPPTNLTVVTVEGCPSFVILDWEKPQNETVTEYKVVSTENGSSDVRDTSIITTNQTHSTVENLKPNTSYAFQVIPSNPLGEGPSSESMPFKTESADPRVTEPISMGKDAIWTEIKFNSDTYSECKGKQYVKRTWYKKFVGVQLCNSLRYKIYLSDTLTGKFYNIGDQRGHGEDHCQFVDSYLDGRTGQQIPSDQLSTKDGFFRAVRQEPVHFGRIGAETHTNYVHWYECGTTIPGKW